MFYDSIYTFVKLNANPALKGVIASSERAHKTQKIDWLKELKFIQDGTHFRKLKQRDYINELTHTFEEGVKNLFSKKEGKRLKALPYFERRKDIQVATVLKINKKKLVPKMKLEPAKGDKPA